jgi:hypothetical protein
MPTSPGRPSSRHVTLAVGVTIVLVVLAACGGSAAVTLEDLAFDTEAHEGDVITTVGTVVEFTEDDGASERHLVIEDDARNRVRLVPLDDAEAFIGAPVEVTGRFAFDPDRGRTLEIDEIREARVGG